MGLSCKRISIVDAVTNGVLRILLVKCRVTKVKPFSLLWLFGGWLFLEKFGGILNILSALC